ncbi:MAG: prepilin peptidase [Bacteroidales bacterium]|nr:prepilin peptidase [Bacteroidales bacterium]MCM1415121.1 prepilin peptidase [bacterium]MCM1423799.1 prepilin peptidase [bacterium]
MLPDSILYLIIFLFGIVIGSFLNVCIYRIPKKEDIVKTASHCMSCGERLKWYDMIPVASFLVLRGKCRKCGAKLSVQYPLIEAANGILYVCIVWTGGIGIESLLYCLLASALLVLSVIDFRTYEIPFGINLFILALGLVRAATDISNILNYLAGSIAVSAVLAVLYYASRGKAIGGGDVKLMAACGLLLGWKLIILAFLLGCVLGAVIHVIRMKVSGEGHVLAMGPYLSMGVLIAAMWGDRLLNWYFGMF